MRWCWILISCLMRWHNISCLMILHERNQKVKYIELHATRHILPAFPLRHQKHVPCIQSTVQDFHNGLWKNTNTPGAARTVRATAAAVGLGGGLNWMGVHEITRQAPTDNTKTRHIRQSPNIQYKAPVSNDL